MRLRDLSDADFDLELARTKSTYESALRVARGAAPTLEVMQGRWDKCNAWHARLNEVEAEERRRAEAKLAPDCGERWLEQEIGI